MSHLKMSGLVLLACLYGCGGSDEEKARNYVVKGQAHLEEDNLVSAKIEFTNALRLDGNSIDALFELSNFSESEKNWPQFEAYLKKLLTLQPEHLEARLKLTHFYIGSGQDEAGKTHVAYLEQHYPDNIDVLIAKAAVLYKDKEKEQARNLVDKVLIAEPNNVEAIFLRINDYVQDNDTKQALALLEKGLSAHPDDLILNMSKINILNRMGDWESTIPVYEHLITAYPENTAPPASLANIYARNGNISKAIKVLEAFAKTNSNETFFIKVVELLNSTEGLASAEKRLKDYIQTYPKLYQLRFALAEIYSKNNEDKLAYSELKQVEATAEEEDIVFEAKNRLARIDLVSGNTQSARTTLEEILKKSPENETALALKSNVLIIDDKAEEAIKVLRTALRTHPKSAELLMTLGRAHEQERQWDLADENYFKALQLSSKNILQTTHYAEFLLRRNKLKQAENLLSPLVLSGVENIKILEMYSHIMLSNHNWDKALKTADSMEALIGDKPEVAHLRGLSLEGKGDNKGAIDAFKHYHTLSPDSTQAMSLLVKSYLKANQRKNAEATIATIVKNDSFKFSGYILKGNLHNHYKEFPAAIAAYEKAIEADRKQLQGHDSLIKTLLRNKLYKAAQQAITNSLSSFPNNVTFNIYQATLYQKLSQNEKAVKIYEGLLSSNTESDAIANNLAVLLQSLGGKDNLERAGKVASRFRQSKIPQYQDTLGWIYAQQGNIAEAVSLLRRAVDRLPKEAEIHYHLGVSYELSKEPAKAKKHLSTSIDLAQTYNISADWVDAAKTALSKL